MAMIPFYSRFRTLAFQETRVARIEGLEGLPDGEYAFLELYCDESGCDCRRVLIQVIGQTTGPKIWASINYGWESLEYYAEWAQSQKIAQRMSGATLDPLNPQTPYAGALLQLFEQIIEDQAYVERLKRHYQMFKPELKQRRAERHARKQKGKRPRK